MPNDLPGLLAKHPSITCLAFNGAKSHDTFMKHFKVHIAMDGLVKLKLPSTSPIPTRTMRTAADRIEAWRVLLPYLRG